MEDLELFFKKAKVIGALTGINAQLISTVMEADDLPIVEELEKISIALDNLKDQLEEELVEVEEEEDIDDYDEDNERDTLH